MIKIELYNLSEKGEILSKKEYLFSEFNAEKFDALSSYINKAVKKITPAFVFTLNLEEQAAIQVLSNIVNGRNEPLYQLSDGSYYFRCWNLVFNIYEE